ncbi:2-phospho-L-lactate transferase [soil metagenome]
MIAALAGGVGGAKMAHGLVMAEPETGLKVIVNTADDFDLFGLRVCPDLDTVMYTLAGLANPVTGWGIDGDSRATLDAVERYQGDSWFLIGDQDFATHIVRTERISDGESLSSVTASLCAALGINAAVLPMTDSQVATIVDTPAGKLAFQDYFVRRRQTDEVTGVAFGGAAAAVASTAALQAIERAGVVVICPSNPIVSIGPIRAVPGFEDALRTTRAVRVAISPIVGGKALKGPADRMLKSLGHESTALGVARLYDGIIDCFVVDVADHDLTGAIESEGLNVLVTNTVMSTIEDRQRLGREVIDFARSFDRRLAHRR